MNVRIAQVSLDLHGRSVYGLAVRDVQEDCAYPSVVLQARQRRVPMLLSTIADRNTHSRSEKCPRDTQADTARAPRDESSLPFYVLHFKAALRRVQVLRSIARIEPARIICFKLACWGEGLCQGSFPRGDIGFLAATSANAPAVGTT